MTDQGAQAGVATAAAAEPDWSALLAAVQRPRTVAAQTYTHLHTSDTKPVELICDDGNTYVVKGLWADARDRPQTAQIKDNRSDHDQGRRMFNEQACGRLGAAMSAPVPKVALVKVSAALIQANPVKMGHLKECVAHGSLKIPDVSGPHGDLGHAGEGDNRSRYCKLSVLFGWLVEADMQFLRGTQAPHPVYSHDHANFLPGGPIWSEHSLSGHVTQATPLRRIVQELGLQPSELSEACHALAAVTPEILASALGAAPAEWLVSQAERIALARFLHARKSTVIDAHVQTKRAQQ